MPNSKKFIYDAARIRHKDNPAIASLITSIDLAHQHQVSNLSLLQANVVMLEKQGQFNTQADSLTKYACAYAESTATMNMLFTTLASAIQMLGEDIEY